MTKARDWVLLAGVGLSLFIGGFVVKWACEAAELFVGALATFLYVLSGGL